MQSILAILSALFIVVGCANTQNELTTSDNSFAKDSNLNNGGRTSSYSLECRNCMAQFKAKLKSEKFTKELLYEMCPACKRD